MFFKHCTVRVNFAHFTLLVDIILSSNFFDMILNIENWKFLLHAFQTSFVASLCILKVNRHESKKISRDNRSKKVLILKSLK